MESTVATFFGYTVSVGGVVAALTQAIKLAESIPFLSKIPFVQWIVDTVTKEDPTAIRIFVVFTCLVLNLVGQWISTGHWPMLDPIMLAATFSSFLAATATFHVVLQPLEPTA